MGPAGKRLMLLVPALLLAALGWLAWSWWQGGADDGTGGSTLPGEVVTRLDDRELPPAPTGGEGQVAPAVPLSPTPAAVTRPAPRAPRQDPVFAAGWLRADVDLDFAALEVILVDRDGDEVADADIEADGRFVVRHDGALAGGWGLSCDAARVTVGGVRRHLMPAFAGPFEAHSPSLPPVECELRLRFPPRILGLVSSARNGRPVEDAEISVGSSLAAFADADDYADTGADGRYVLEVGEIPPGGVLVWCRAWEHQATVVGPFDLPDSGDLVLNFTVEKVRPLKGNVLDARTGAPVEGAEVTLGSSYMVFEDDEDWDFTDAKGRFSLDPEDMPLEGAWIHAAGPDGYGPAAVRLEGHVGDRIEILLPTLAVLEGVVRDEAGRPLDDAEILVVFSVSWFGVDDGICNDALADEQGAFRVELDAALPEESRLIVEAPGHLAFEAPLMDVAVWNPAGGVWHVDVTLAAESAPAATEPDPDSVPPEG